MSRSIESGDAQAITDDHQLGLAPGDDPLVVAALQVGGEEHQQWNLKTLDVLMPRETSLKQC